MSLDELLYSLYYMYLVLDDRSRNYHWSGEAIAEQSSVQGTLGSSDLQQLKKVTYEGNGFALQIL